MKNKLISILIIIFSVCALSFTLTACGHTDDYKTLKSNDLTHWVECECGDKTAVELHNLKYKNYVSYDKVCSICNHIVPHSHDYTELRFDNQNHWYECICGDKKDIEVHKGGTPTCTESPVCDVCDRSYGIEKGHDYANPVPISNEKHILTCTNDNSHTLTVSCIYKDFIINSYGVGTGTCICGDTKTTQILNIQDNVVTGVTAYGTTLSEITIPNNVIKIGDYALSGCYSLTSIVIPDSVTSIGYYAFRYCDSLTSIEIGDNVTSIGDYAFEYCSSLTSIEIPDSVTSIGDGAFSGCSNLHYNIKDNLKYLGNSTNLYLYLADVTSTYITSATIDSNCRFIGSSAFSDCDSLTSIEIPDSVTSIGYWAFYNCDSLTIYCEAESKPSAWSSYWNSSDRPVVWGYKGENE